MFNLIKNISKFNRAVLCTASNTDKGHLAMGKDDHFIKIVDLHNYFSIVDTLMGHKRVVSDILRYFTDGLLN